MPATIHYEELVYLEILRSLPPLDFAFAYGSGVFEQDGYNEGSDEQQQPPSSSAVAVVDPSALPMLDLVLAVRNPIEWHQQNLERNWGHYSVLRYLGAERLGQIQGKSSHVSLDGCDLPFHSHRHTHKYIISRQRTTALPFITIRHCPCRARKAGG